MKIYNYTIIATILLTCATLTLQVIRYKSLKKEGDTISGINATLEDMIASTERMNLSLDTIAMEGSLTVWEENLENAKRLYRSSHLEADKVQVTLACDSVWKYYSKLYPAEAKGK